MSKYDDPEHWRARATQARAMADRMIRPDAKARMNAIAEQYEKIADGAAQRLRAVAEGRPPLASDDGDGDRD